MYRFYGTIFLVVLILAVYNNIPDLTPVIDYLGSHYTRRQLEITFPAVAEEKTVSYGWAYYKMGKPDMAKDIMREVLESESNISALYCLGLIELEQGSYEPAAKRLQAVLKLAPQHVPSLLNLGRAYYFSGRYSLAKQCFDSVLKEEPQNREALVWREKTCSRAGI